MTTIQDTTATDRVAETAAGLRALAEFIEQHPELPVPHVGAHLFLYSGDAVAEVVAAMAPCSHGTEANNPERYEFVRNFGSRVSLRVDVAKKGLFVETVRNTTVLELPADLAAAAEGTVRS